MSGTIYNLLLPREKTCTQAFWDQHIAILRSAAEGVPYHLGTISALLAERLCFFKEDPSRSNGLLLLQVSATAWQIIRGLTDITGDERDWFKKQVHQPDSLKWVKLGVMPFFEQMHEVYNIACFLRHPMGQKDRIMAYDWIFHGTWPQEKVDFIIQAASSLHSIMGLVVNEFSLVSGWEGDTRKKVLHDNAMSQWASAHEGVH